MRVYYLLIILICPLITTISAQSVIQVETNRYTPQRLVEDVLINSNCTEISNISFNGTPNQIGYFSDGMSSIDMTDGIILSTGDVRDASGPNLSSRTSTDFSTDGILGDADLAQVASVDLNDIKDVAILEFDFTAISDEVEFTFVFASEEYCEFAGPTSVFNDVFGFFLSGPGINGPYENSAVNLALNPENSAPITVLNINHNINKTYFIDNTPKDQLQYSPRDSLNCRLTEPNGDVVSLLDTDGHSVDFIEYDGFTTHLVARSTVQPNQTYHLKIAIADVNDYRWDSAVFLLAKSFSAGQPVARVSAPDTLTCIEPEITLDGSGSTRSSSFNLSWYTDNGNIVGSNVGPTIRVNREGTYHLVVENNFTGCQDSSAVDVYRAPSDVRVDTVLLNSLSCIDTQSTIIVNMESPGQYFYELQYPDGTISTTSTSNQLSSTQAGSHTIMVRNQWGCRELYSFDLPINNSVSTSMPIVDTITCDFPFAQIDLNLQDASAPYQIAWSTSNGSIDGNAGGEMIRVTTEGLYIATIHNLENGCMRTDSIQVVALTDGPDIYAGTGFDMDCTQPFESIDDAYIHTDYSIRSLSWSSPDGGLISYSEDPIVPKVFAPGIFILQVEDVHGCTNQDTIMITRSDQPPSIYLVDIDTGLCSTPFWKIEIETRGDAISDILWSVEDNLYTPINEDGTQAIITEEGTISIEVIDVKGCVGYFEVDLFYAPQHIQLAHDSIRLNCDGLAELSILNAQEDENIFWLQTQYPGDTLYGSIIEVSDPGLYIAHRQDKISGCVLVDTTIVLAQEPEVRLAIDYWPCDKWNAWFDIMTDDEQYVTQYRYEGQIYQPDEQIAVNTASQVLIDRTDGCLQIFKLKRRIFDSLTVTLPDPLTLEYGLTTAIRPDVNRSDDAIQSVSWSGDVKISCTTCLETQVTLDDIDQYELTVEVTDDLGCVNYYTTGINPIFTMNTFIPTAFSPNNDGINDVLEIFGDRILDKILTVRIYNRWGGKVFDAGSISSTNDPYDPKRFFWNGTCLDGKPCQEGVYTLSAELQRIDGVKEVRTKDVLLMR